MWQHCCNFVYTFKLLIQETGQGEVCLILNLTVGVNLGEEHKQGVRAAHPTQYNDGGNWQAAADSWLEDNRNCCRPMHALMTALLPPIWDCVCNNLI